MTPVSLLTYMIDANWVSSRNAASNLAGSRTPSGAGLHPADVEAFRREPVEHVGHGLVLGPHRHDVPAAMRPVARAARDRQVVGLGCARRPDERVRDRR